MAGEKRDFDAGAATWDENPYRVRLAEDVSRALQEKIPLTPEMDVLEVGCGTGLLTLLLQPRARSITGIDSSAGMLDVLRSKIKDKGLTNVTTRLMDLETGEEWEGTFDLVVSSMTLHHIDNIPRLFYHFSSVVKPGGYLVVADLDKEGGKFHRHGEIVPHAGFDRGLMKKEFERAGFCNVRNCTAAMPVKPDSCGDLRCFTVFLMTGKKRDDAG
jgi:ubiquinone/menaquinone biosynthesis C-methylase UbiE